MKKHLIITIITAFLLPCQVFAQIFFELEATQDTFIEYGSILLISEVNLKNKEADWIELYYFSPADEPLNLKGLKFKEDKIIKEITENFQIESNDFLLLLLNSNNEDSTPNFYSAHKGLTGTTEQITILDHKNEIIDAVCWQNSSPAATEIKDLESLLETNEWESGCINSDDIKTNYSIIRTSLKDTNSVTDWKISETPTPLTTNIIYIQKEKSSAPTSLPDDSLIFSEKTTISGSQKNEEESIIKSFGGNTAKTIIISEIMPNPEGSDTGNEWIELANIGNSPVNLINWSIDDIEGGSKPYRITKKILIEPEQTYVFLSAETKISLGNNTDSVRLIDPNNYIADEVSYSDAPSGKSYAFINDEWIWTDQPTPNQKNPIYEEIAGIVIFEPDFEEDYFFRIKDIKDNVLTILFNEDTVPAPLAKATFKEGASLLILAAEKRKNIFELIRFEILEQPSPSNKNNYILPSIIITTLAITAAGLFALRKFGKL